jgi:hypothetical protein
MARTNLLARNSPPPIITPNPVNNATVIHIRVLDDDELPELEELDMVEISENCGDMPETSLAEPRGAGAGNRRSRDVSVPVL